MQCLSEEQKNLMHFVIDEILKNPLSDDFREPVDWVGMWIYDYPTIIKNPMDLSTVKNRIVSYTSIEQYLHDIILIWDNCKTYNKLNSVLI